MKPPPHVKVLLFIGGAVYAVLALYSIIFFKERTIFLDVSFHLFYIIKDNDFAIQANRFGAALTQIFPLLSARLNLPLKWVMINYSLGVVLYYFGIFWLCAKVFKNERLGLAMVLFSTLMVSYTFWWMQIEFAQGIALTILFFGFIAREKQWQHYNFLEIALFFIILFTIVYFHPLIPVVFIYLFLFFLLEKEQIINRNLFLAAGVAFVAILYIKNSLLPAANYDANAVEALDNFELLYPDYLDIPANKNFIQYCFTDYYLLPIGLIIIIGVYLFTRNWLKLVLVISFFFGYLLLVNVSFYQGMPQFHIESFYLPLSIFVIFPLVYDVAPLVRDKRIFFIILALVFIIRLVHIKIRHQSYTERLAWMEHLLEKTDTLSQKKLIISQEDVPLDTLIMVWGSPYEFWLLSTLEGNTRSVLILENISEVDWALDQNDAFITKWGVFKYHELPKRYFNFADTTGYQKIEPQTIQ